MDTQRLKLSLEKLSMLQKFYSLRHSHREVERGN